MKTAGNKVQAQNLLKPSEELNVVLYLIKQGKKIDLLKIEPDLTPNILFGETDDQRI